MKQPVRFAVSLTGAAAPTRADALWPGRPDAPYRRRSGFGFALVAAAIVLVAANSASASVRISDDYGGQIGRYLEHYRAVRDAGERVIIDGLCLSACTLVLGVVPRERICVTAGARLGFHAAWRRGERASILVSDEGTALLMATYPQEIRDWISQRGGLTGQVKYLGARELAAMYQTCK
jgi:hypothetical protein